MFAIELFSAIIQNSQNPVKKILAFRQGNQGDANFRVGLQKNVTPGALYCIYSREMTRN